MNTPASPNLTDDFTLLRLFSLEPEEFLRDAYLYVLGRPIDDVGLAFYLRRLSEGALRIQILQEISASPEGRAANRGLPGLPAPIASRWWHRLAFWRQLRSNDPGQNWIFEVNMISRSLNFKIEESVKALRQQLHEDISGVLKRQVHFPDALASQAVGHVNRGNMQIEKNILNRFADNFPSQAFHLISAREARNDELEHFQHAEIKKEKSPPERRPAEHLALIEGAVQTAPFRTVGEVVAAKPSAAEHTASEVAMEPGCDAAFQPSGVPMEAEPVRRADREFDERWYLSNYPDVAAAGIDPYQHYVLFGRAEGRAARMDHFDPNWYAFQYPDVAKAGFDLYDHYVRFGKAEGRLARRPYDPGGDVDRNSLEFTLRSWFEVNDGSTHRQYTTNGRLARLGLLGTLGQPSQSELGQLRARFHALLLHVDLVTFDVFDTLIERDLSTPSDVFRHMEQELPSSLPRLPNFAAERVAAEDLVRRSSIREEVSIEEIYGELERRYGLLPGSLSALQHLEHEFERQHLRARTVGRTLLQSALECGKRVLLLSDFYMSAESVEKLLHACGYPSLDLLVSSDVGLTKHTGRLFDHALKCANVNGSKVLHVGDNEYSDGHSARSRGIRTLLIPRGIQLLQSAGFFDAEPESRKPSAYTLRESRLLADLATCRSDWSFDLSVEGRASDANRLGFERLGPLLLAVAEFVLNTAQKRGYKHLHFVARDGFYIKAAYDQLVKALGTQAPTSHYVVSSRALALKSCIENVDDIERISRVPYKQSTLRVLLSARFDLDDDDLGALSQAQIAALGIPSLDAIMTHPQSDAIIGRAAMLLSERIFSRSRALRTVYVEYLRGVGLDQDDCAIVDIGYSGTIQVALSRLMSAAIGGLYFVTWPAAEQLRQRNLPFDSMIGPNDPLISDFNAHIQLFETLFSATHPSLVGIQRGTNGAFWFVYSSSMFPARVIDALAELRQGAIWFIERAARVAPPTTEGEDILSSAWAMTPIVQLLRHPGSLFASMLSSIVFEDDIGGENRFMCIDPATLSDVSIAEAVASSCWPAGTEALNADDLRYEASPVLRPDARPFVHAGRSYRLVDQFEGDEIRPAYLDLLPIAAARVDPSLSAPPRVALIRQLGCRASDIDAWQDLLLQDHQNWILVLVEPRGMHEPVQLTLPEGRGPAWIVTVEGSANDMRGAVELALDGKAELLVWCDENAEVSSTLLLRFALQSLEEGAQIVYSDHADISGDGHVRELVFKPDWSPELFMSTPYVGSTFGINASSVKRILEAGPRELSLAAILVRSAETATRVAHISEVLWCDPCANQALDADWSEEQRQFLRRHAIQGTLVERHIKRGRGNVLVRDVRFPDEGPSVAILIPTKNHRKLLERCVSSLARTTYRNYRIYIIDNESDESEALAYLACCGHAVLRIKSPVGGFNYSYINNCAVRQTTEELLVFLNNDTEVITPEWLSQMVGWTQINSVGSVGARLLYGDGKVQHAGIINGLLGGVLPAPAFKLLERDDAGYLGYAMTLRNCSAVTAACMLTRRSIFESLGGFDEVRFGVAYNDTDYGFRLVKAGYRNVYSPTTVLYHREGRTRGTGAGNDKPSEEAASIAAYGNWADPYYNPNLESDATDFRLGGRTVRADCMPTLKVVAVTHNLNLEGAPLILFEIITGLQRTGQFSIHVVSPADGPLRRRYEEVGIDVSIVSVQGVFQSRHGIAYFKQLTQARELLTQLRPHVVIGNTVLTWWAIDSARSLRIPSVWCIHESEDPFSHFDEHGLFLKRTAASCLAFPYQVVFVSFATKRLYEPIRLKNNLSVIHNGFDGWRLRRQIEDVDRNAMRASLDLGADDVLLLTVGTVCERKNQIELVQALELLPAQARSRLKVIVVGDRASPYSQELHRAIANLPHDLAKRVQVVRETDQVGRYYLAADAFVLTSKLESFPVVIQEAMHFGLPILTNGSFGIREQVTPGVNSMFYRLGDIQQLSECISRMVADNALRHRMGDAARAALDRLPTVPEMVERYGHLLKEAWLSERPRTPMLKKASAAGIAINSVGLVSTQNQNWIRRRNRYRTGAYTANANGGELLG